eukprot:scaffold134241_cov22-Tisochrysis_lutea.AAC.1
MEACLASLPFIQAACIPSFLQASGVVFLSHTLCSTTLSLNHVLQIRLESCVEQGLSWQTTVHALTAALKMRHRPRARKLTCL